MTEPITKLEKPLRAWRELLPPAAFAILFKHATEPPGTSPAQSGASRRHIRLRGLPPAALRVVGEVRERHGVAELLPGDRGPHRDPDRLQDDPAQDRVPLHSLRRPPVAMCSRTARRRPAGAIATTVRRWRSSRTVRRRRRCGIESAGCCGCAQSPVSVAALSSGQQIPSKSTTALWTSRTARFPCSRRTRAAGVQPAAAVVDRQPFLSSIVALVGHSTLCDFAGLLMVVVCCGMEAHTSRTQSCDELSPITV
ncbi:hypothetical protein GBAR_LOCUS23779 [Geodia barretti]|uniref:Uncharacterized protein n=1 Tax=Geodia barretti TaxID=519541 RepID=A0AA35T9N5_GEOBA|nr:hypothetical protein GBAR_LOCUS23779 [Geodia barretti]